MLCRLAKNLLLLIACIGYSDSFTTPQRAVWGLKTTNFAGVLSFSTQLFSVGPRIDSNGKGNGELEPSLEVTQETQEPFEKSPVGGYPLANASADSKENGEAAADDVWKARTLLAVAAALYGTNFSLVKLLGNTMPEGISLTLRFALAALVTLPWLFEDIQNDGTLMATWLGFEVGIWNSIGYIAQAVGLETTQASKSAFICSLAVVTVPLLDSLTGKRIEARQWIGAILAVIGVGVLELGGSADMTMSNGDWLSLVQPLAFGLGFWKIERALHRYPSEARRMTAAQLFAAFCASIGYAWWTVELSDLQSYPWTEWLTSPPILFSLFWTGVITTALTIYMESKAMETLSAAEATVIFSTEPLWGTAFAAAVMSEQLGFNSAIGAAFIMTACFYSNLGLGGISGMAKGMNEKSREVPAKIKNNWAVFTSSLTAAWASWNVAVANAAENLPDMDCCDEALKDIVNNLVDKLPF